MTQDEKGFMEWAVWSSYNVPQKSSGSLIKFWNNQGAIWTYKCIYNSIYDLKKPSKTL